MAITKKVICAILRGSTKDQPYEEPDDKLQCLSPAKKYKFYKSSINKSIHFVQRILSSSTRKEKVPVRASSKGCTIRRVEIPSNKLLTTAFEASLECIIVM